MGNVPSTETVGEQRKLTKPKTNNHGSFQASRLVPQPSPSPTAQLSDPNCDDVVWTSGGTFRSTDEARQQIRSQLFGTKDAEIYKEAANSEDGRDSLGELASSVKDRLTSLSRTGSLLSDMPSSRTSSTRINNPFNGSRASLPPDLRTLDIESTIALLQELKKTASPEDLVALHKALLPTKPVEPASNPISPVDAPVGPLVRRRSLAVPGLATRDTYDILRKQNEASLLSSSSSDQEHLWKLREFEPSPSNRMTTLEAPREESSYGPRATTPGDMDYALLGSKLGTLTITNGAPSPAPSVLTRPTTNQMSMPNLHEPQDYFAKFESVVGSEAPDTSFSSRPTTAHRRVRSTFAASSSSTAGLVPPVPEGSRRAEKSPRPSSSFDSRQFQNSTGRSSDETLTEFANEPRRISDAAVTAQEYISELASSPFGDSPWANDDASEYAQLSNFDDEGYQAPSEDLSLPEDALDTLNKSPFADEMFLTDVSTKNSLELNPNNSTDEQTQRPPQKHTDSGYSSGASLKAVKATPNVSGGLQPRCAVVAESNEDAKSMYTIRAMLAMAPPEEPEPAATGSRAPKPERLPLLRTKSWKRFSFKSSVPSSPVPPSPVPCITDRPESSTAPAKPVRQDSGISTEQPGLRTSKSKKLLRKRKSSIPSSPIVQAFKPIRKGSVPEIPADVSAQYTRRLTESPQMANLDHTFASVNHEEPIQEEDAAASAAAVSIRFPSPTPEEGKNANANVAESTTRSRKPKRTQSTPRLPSKSPRRRSLSLHLSRKSKEVTRDSVDEPVPSLPTNDDNDDDEAGPTIQDFGTVAASLGGSPYDIAMDALTARPRVAAATLPYHCSTSMLERPRAPARATMDAATASEFARLRSRERTSAGTPPVSSEKQQQQQRSPPSAPNFSRPSSWQQQPISRETTPTPPLSLPRSPVVAPQRQRYYEPYRPGKTSATVTLTDAERAAALSALEGSSSSSSRGASPSASASTSTSVSTLTLPPVLRITTAPQETGDKASLPTSGLTLADEAVSPLSSIPPQPRHAPPPPPVPAARAVPPLPKLNIQAPTPTPETQLRSAPAEVASGWENASRVWRLRRQSLGEGLKAQNQQQQQQGRRGSAPAPAVPVLPAVSNTAVPPVPALPKVEVGAKAVVEVVATSPLAASSPLASVSPLASPTASRTASPIAERPAMMKRRSTIKRYYAGVPEGEVEVASGNGNGGNGAKKEGKSKKEKKEKERRKSRGFMGREKEKERNGAGTSTTTMTTTTATTSTSVVVG